VTPLPAVPPELVNIGIDVVLHYALDGFDSIAHRAGPVLARMLFGRFGGGQAALIDGPDLQTAQNRLRTFAEELDRRICDLEQAQKITNARLDQLFARPEVTGALQAAFDSAIEVDDQLSCTTLADLVIERLSAADDSARGATTRIAIERMRDITPHQVRLLALILLLRLDPLSDISEQNRPIVATRGISNLAFRQTLLGI